MTTGRQSETFRMNILFWTIFGIWPGGIPKKYYKFCSGLFLLVTFIIYNTLLTLNMLYTPRKIELLIHEVIFYFTEVAVTFKIIMVMHMRNKILAAFEILDCETFKADNETERKIIDNNNQKYITCWKVFTIWCHFAYLFLVFVPLIRYLVWGSNYELPVCKYYFLSDETIRKYFLYLFIYQSVGLYVHMTYDINIDSFIPGLMLMALSQLRVINHKLTSLKLGPKELGQVKKNQEYIQKAKLLQCLRHYDLVLKYCSIVQKLLNVTMFVQFGVASAIICVVMCGLLLSSTTETLLFMVFYFFAMASEIFVPAWLGTQISYETKELVTAAYTSEWIPRSKEFKRSLILFVERCNTPIVFTGLKIFPLSLRTFTSIIRTAYSLFTLVRNVQNRQ